jgi:hypothetical protein
MRWVPYSMPLCALTTIAQVSTAASADSVGPRKSAAPGVSIRLMWQSAWSIEAMAVFSDCLRSFSSGS